MYRDLRHALRVLLRSPVYSLAVLLTLALGIGATSAVLSVVRTVLLRPLPYAPPDRVFIAMENDPAGQFRLASYPTFLDWRQGTRSFEGLAYVRGRGAVLKTGGDPLRVVAAYTTEDFFEVLSESPLLGRTLAADDFRPDAGAATVLSYRLWMDRFAGDRDVLGRSVVVGERTFVVVGVMPETFGYPPWAEMFVPLTAIAGSDPALSQRGLHVDSRVIGRLRPGIDSTAGRADLSAVAARLAQAYPAENGGWGAAALYPLTFELVGDLAPQIRLLALASCLVLLIACVNVANLALARGAVRAPELALRTALGASRASLLRLLAAEALILGALATVLGGLAGLWLTGWLRAEAGGVLPRVEEIGLDGAVVAGVALLAMLMILVLGIGPSLAAGVVKPAGDLRRGSGRVSRRLRGGLVVAEFALALVLLVCTGLLVHSLQRLQQVNPGFDVDRLLAVAAEPPPSRYADPVALQALMERVAAAVGRVPGVEAVGLTNHVPLSGASMPTRFEADGVPVDSTSGGDVLFREIDQHYIRAAGIPLVAGRNFTATDIAHPGDAVLVNRTLANRYWPGADAVGKWVTVYRAAQGKTDFGQPVRATVAGVIGDVRHYSLEDDFTPEVYVPYTLSGPKAMTLLARANPGAGDLTGAVRRAVLAEDADILVQSTSLRNGVLPVTEMLRATLAYRKLIAGVLAAFAVPALLLAALGIYGVVAYLVTQRRYEIAIRMALGATERSVLGLMIRQGLWLALAGVGLGAAGALGVSRLLRSELYEVSAADPISFLGSAVVLILIGLLATYLPARRAAAVAPMRTLRSE